MNIIAVKHPKYLSHYCHSSLIGIPTEFWVAKKKLFPKAQNRLCYTKMAIC